MPLRAVRRVSFAHAVSSQLSKRQFSRRFSGWGPAFQTVAHANAGGRACHGSVASLTFFCSTPMVSSIGGQNQLASSEWESTWWIIWSIPCAGLWERDRIGNRSGAWSLISSSVTSHSRDTASSQNLRRDYSRVMREPDHTASYPSSIESRHGKAFACRWAPPFTTRRNYRPHAARRGFASGGRRQPAP